MENRASSADKKRVPTFVVTDPSTSIQNLEPDTSHCVRVRAINAQGAGPWSDIFAVRTEPAAPSAPGAVSIVAVSESTVTVAWDPPPCNGSPVLRYRLQINGESHELPSECLTSQEYTCVGLQPNETYKLRLQASSAVGDGPCVMTCSVCCCCLARHYSC